MSNLVRFFAASSIIALGGMTALVNVVACSSTKTTEVAGDDDDDAGKTTSSSSSSGSTSSSTSSGGAADSGPPCDPAGTYAFGTTTLTATGGKVCSDYAQNSGAAGPTVTFTKNTADAGVEGITYIAKAAGSTGQTVLLLANDKCQLAGGEQPYGQQTKDADGAEINVELSPSDVYTFDGATATFQSFIQIASDPAGAPGTPCSLTATSSGTKK